MQNHEELWLYQEVLLLSLREDRGTKAFGVWAEQALGGAVLADLLMSGRVCLDGRRDLVSLEDDTPLGDPVLDACLAQIGAAARRAPAERWVSRFATCRLFHSAAQRLCELGVLRMANQSVLLVFSRRVYPELDPRPEREIVERLHDAIFTDRGDLDAGTAVLVALASATELLRVHFGRKSLRGRKARIEQITRGDAIGAATAAVVRNVQAAIIVATTVPAITACT